MMIDDPIVNEIREIRTAYAMRFDNDLKAISNDLKQQENESRRQFRTPLESKNESQTAMLPEDSIAGT